MTDGAHIPTLFCDQHGLVSNWAAVPTHAYRRVTITHDGPLLGRDVLVQKRADGTAALFLLPGHRVRKAFPLPGIAAPPSAPLAKTFGEMEAVATATKAAAPKPPTAPPAWTSTTKPTHLVALPHPTMGATYLGLPGDPGPGLHAQKIGNPAATADGSVAARNGATLPMTAAERTLNRAHQVASPQQLPSLGLGSNAEEARSRYIHHPDFDMLDRTRRLASAQDRMAALHDQVTAGGLVPSDLPAHYAGAGRAYMGIGPDGHVIHLATAATPQMRAELPHGDGTYAYGEHTHKPAGRGDTGGEGEYPNRAHADAFLHHAISNPAWVTIRRDRYGKETMYRHVYIRPPKGEKSDIGRWAPGGITYVAERVKHPDDPTGSHWNMFTAITNQGSRMRHRELGDYTAHSHWLADDNRGQMHARGGESPDDRAWSRVRYAYVNRNAPASREGR